VACVIGDLDIERILDFLLGALFAAFLSQGRPHPDWSRRTVDAIWPAPASTPQTRRRRRG
jgi:hypothetical protein